MAYSKTETGQRTFKDRSVPLTPRQRSAFILFDGKRSLADVLAATSGLGVVPDDIDYMIEMGLLEGTPGGSGGSTTAFGEMSRPMGLESRPAPLSAPLTALPTTAVETGAGQDRYKLAYPIATRITAGLGLRGFRLNIAVEAAGSYEKLLELAPRIREAVGDEKFRPLDAVLRGD